MHQGFDAARSVAVQATIDPAKVSRIDVGTYHHAVDAPFRRTVTPANASEAGYSLPTAVALGLLFNSLYAEDIARFNDPRVQALLPKIHVGVDERIQSRYPDWNGCVVRVTLADGRAIESRLDHAKGEPENMLTDAEFDAKLRFAVGDLLPESQRRALAEAALSLEDLREVGTLVRLATRTAV